MIPNIWHLKGSIKRPFAICTTPMVEGAPTA